MKRAAIYAGVSTRNGHQDPEVQLMALRQVPERAGWQIVEEYVDHGISGAKGRDEAPGFRSPHEGRHAPPVRGGHGMERGPDSGGRSGSCCVLGEVHAQAVDLYLDRQGVDTTTPGGKALFQMMGVFAEFEREMIRDRVCAGPEKARARTVSG